MLLQAPLLCHPPLAVLTIWRLEKERYADDALRGKGSLKTSGRWHRQGTQVAYASEHPGTAVLEQLVWLGSYGVARASRYVLLPLHLDPEEHLETLDASDLREDWDAFPPSRRHLHPRHPLV